MMKGEIVMKSCIYVLITFSLLVLAQRGGAQWVQTNGPGLSTTTSIVSSGAFLFVAASDHSVFRSS